MPTTESSTTPERREARRSKPPPSGGVPSRCRGERADVGAVYLDTFGIPAVHETTETYHLVYATVRAVTEGKAIAHAQVAAKAAYDAAADRINRWLHRGAA